MEQNDTIDYAFLLDVASHIKGKDGVQLQQVGANRCFKSISFYVDVPVPLADDAKFAAVHKAFTRMYGCDLLPIQVTHTNKAAYHYSTVGDVPDWQLKAHLLQFADKIVRGGPESDVARKLLVKANEELACILEQRSSGFGIIR